MVLNGGVRSAQFNVQIIEWVSNPVPSIIFGSMDIIICPQTVNLFLRYNHMLNKWNTLLICSPDTILCLQHEHTGTVNPLHGH